MSAFAKLMRLLTPTRSRDYEFETYYGSLVLRSQEGVPSAEEARRDYEPVRRIIDRATIY